MLNLLKLEAQTERVFMKDSHLIKMMQTFTGSELRSFSRFVDSPYYNTSRSTTLLYYEIKKYYPAFTGSDFSRELLFKKVYPGRKYSSDLMNRLVSNLIKLAEKFISDKANRFEDLNLLAGLRKRKLKNYFLSGHKKITEKRVFNLYEEDDIMQQLLFDEEYGNYFLDADKYIQWDRHVDLAMEYNLIHFLYRVSQVFRQKTFSSTEKDRKTNAAFHLEECIDLKRLNRQIANSDVKNKETICHYLSLVILNSTKDKKLYEEIRDYIFGNDLINSTNNIYTGYIYLLDFLTDILKQTKGDVRRHYLKEKNRVYKKIESVYFATGRVEMLFVFFRNFVLSGINTGELEWSEYVLKKYLNQIKEKGNEPVGKYYDALILFHKGMFEESLEKLSFFKSEKYFMDNDIHFYDIRILRLMLYFELNYLQEALSMVDAFTHLLSRSRKMPAAHKESAVLFATAYRKLLACKADKKVKSLPELIKKILEGRSYNGKTWLLNKAKELHLEESR